MSAQLNEGFEDSTKYAVTAGKFSRFVILDSSKPPIKAEARQIKYICIKITFFKYEL